MPPKRATNAQLLTAADQCGGDVGKIAEALGLSSTSNIARRLKRILWEPRQVPAVDQGEVSDDKTVLLQTLGAVARLWYERGLTEDALESHLRGPARHHRGVRLSQAHILTQRGDVSMRRPSPAASPGAAVQDLTGTLGPVGSTPIRGFDGHTDSRCPLHRHQPASDAAATPAECEALPHRLFG